MQPRRTGATILTAALLIALAPVVPVARAQQARAFPATAIYAGTVGSHIGQALAPNGRPYSELRTAFMYRDRIVPQCTCNGKDALGMAAIAIETDLTLRSGDMIATNKGFKVFTVLPGMRAQPPVSTKLP